MRFITFCGRERLRLWNLVAVAGSACLMTGLLFVNAPAKDREGQVIESRATVAGTPVQLTDAATRQHANTPMSFEANQGQTDGEVKFLSRGRGYTFFLTPTQSVLSLQRTEPAPALPGSRLHARTKWRRGNVSTAVLRMNLAGANPEPVMESLDPLEGRVNYFLGADPRRWRTGVQTYGKILYREIYPGIDLVYYGQQGQLEFDFVLRPGARPEAIRLQFDGAEDLQLDAAGELMVQIGGQPVRWPKPLVYQLIEGVKKEIQGGYVIKDNQEVAFQLSAYDLASPLVIDPVLVYSTYLGGANLDSAEGMALDRSGNVYLTGQTISLNFPTRNAYRKTLAGSNDVFVTKLNSNGTALVYSTYFGGSGDDFAAGIAVDTNGNAYVTGQTDSQDFPTRSAYQSSLAGGGGFSDAFVFKLGPTGSNLVYSTYFGGSDIEYANAIAVDSSGSVYITGATASGSGFPKSGPFQNNAGGGLDAFVTKFSSSGSSLVYSSWLGGQDEEQGNAIAVDSSGNAYVAGEVFSLDSFTSTFPVVNALQPLYGGGDIDVFVTKVNAGGSALVFSTFLGGDDNDSGLAITLDSSSNIYITGETRSTNFPITVNAFQPIIGGGLEGTFDAFVTKLPATGASILYSTFLGGESDETGAAIAVDSTGQIYVTGSTDSPFDFPVTDSADQLAYNYGTSDAFVTKLNPAVPGPSALIYSTYWGGNGSELGIGDAGTGIAVDTNANFYVCGVSDSIDILTSSGALQRTYGGGPADGFVAKFYSTNDISVSITASPNPVLVGSNLTYTVQVNNNWRTTATGIFLTNFLPGSVTFVSMTTNRMTCATNSGGVIICNVGTLTNLASASATFTVKTTVPTNLTDTAILVSNQSEMNTDNNAPSLTTVVRGFANLAITQTDNPDPVFATSNLTYTITVTNLGPWTASDILVTNVFSPTVNFVTATQNLPGDYYYPDDATNVIIFEVFTNLPAGSNATFTVTVSPQVPGVITNQVGVSAFESDLTPANNVSSISSTVVNMAELELSTTVSPTTPITSSNVTYTLTVTNNGPANASSVIITNRLPSTTSYVSSLASSGGSCSVAGSVVTCTFNTVSTGAIARVTIVAKANAEGSITNISNVRSSLADANLANNTVTNINGVMPLVDLVLLGTDSPDPVTLNSNLVYTLVITNRGVSIAPNSVLTDTLPGSVSFVSATPSQGSCSVTGSVVTCSLGSISNLTTQVMITVTPTVVGFITNRASVSTPTTDVNLTNNSITISTKVNSPPTISGPSDQAIDEDTRTSILNFTVGDLETPASNLVVTASSSNPGLIAAASFTYGGTGTNRTLRILPLTNQFGTATITVTVIDSDNGAASTSFVLTVNPVNDPPTLNALNNMSITEDAPTQMVNLTGITSGATNEIQTLTISAFSSDNSIIPDPTVIYTSANSTGRLSFAPVLNAFGTATITVMVDDGGASNHVVTQTFTVVVVPVNDPPTLAAISNLTANEDAGLQTVNLAGISSGAPNEPQTLVVSASHNNPSLLTGVTVNYNSPNPGGTLSFSTLTNASGTALVTVTVNDGGASNNIATRTFTVTIIPVNDPPTLDPIPDLFILEDAGAQTISLTGISSGAPDEIQTLTVLASNSAPTLLTNLAVSYTSPLSAGSLSFTTVTNAFGTNTITVTVTDGGTSNNITTRTFTVGVASVNDLPTAAAISDKTTDEDVPITIPVTIGDVETPAASLGLSLASSDTSLVSDASVTFGGSGSNRTVRILPLTNANGSATMTLTVTDGDGGVTSTSFNLLVNPVNDLPVVSNVPNQTTDEDTLLGPISFTVSDVENAAGDLIVMGSSSNQGLVPDASIVFGGSGAIRTFSLLPATNQFGTATITLSVVDSNGGVGTDTFLLTVNSVNDLPTISALPDITINEDNPAVVSFTVGDVETAAGSLTLSALSSNTGLVPNANVVFGGSGANRTATITPATNANGSSLITITVTDANGGSAADQLILTVLPVNDPPTLTTIANLIIDEDAGLQTVSLNGIAAGPANESQTLAVSAVSSDTTIIPNPTVNYTSPNATGTLTFTPVTNANGVVTITVTVNDNAGSNNLVTRTFTVTVNPVNDPPTIIPIPVQTTDEDTSIIVPFTVIDIDSPGAQVTVTGVSSNTAMVANSALVFSGSNSNRTVTITPSPNQFGTNVITLTTSDGAATGTASFVLRINPINDPPTLNPIPNQILGVSPGNVTVNLSGITSGATNEFQTLSVTAVSSDPSIGIDPTVSYTSPSTTGSLRFHPSNGSSGSAQVTVTVNDNQPVNNLISRSFLVYVGQTNQAPTISTMANQTVNEDTSTGLRSFTVGDLETPASLLTVSGSSSNQVLVPDAGIVFGGSGSNRNLTITPATNQFGTTLITVTVQDTNFLSASTSFLLTVLSVNDLPTISAIPNQTIDEDTSTGTITFNVGDVETAVGTLTLSATSSNTNLVRSTNMILDGANANRTILINPLTNQFGTTHITVTITDGDGGSASSGFDLTVKPINDPPTLNAIGNVTINEDGGPQMISLSGISGGPTNESQALTLIATSSDPSIVPNPTVSFTNSTGVLTFVPLTNANGTVTIAVTANDNAGSNNLVTQSFVVTINSINDAPSLDPIPNLVINENAPQQVVNLTGIGSGAANESQALIVTASSSNPGLIPNPAVTYSSPSATGALTFTPTANSNGVVTITVNVNDGQPNNNSVTRTFTVAINGAPKISGISPQTINEDTSSAAIPFTVQANVTPASMLVVTASSSNTNLVPNQNITLGGSGTNRTITLTPLHDQFGNATITLTVTDTNGASASTFFQLAVNSVNDAPTMNPIADITLAEDAGTNIVSFSGITTGASNEVQTLNVMAVSSNPTLIPNPTVTYTSPNSSGSLAFAPLTNANGIATITVTVNDGGTTNGSFSRMFTVTVAAINDPPTLNPLGNVTLNEDAGVKTVNLTGITSGAANENQTLSVSVTNSNPALLTNFSVSYASPASSGTLTFSTVTNASGTALITVAVNDGAGSNSIVNQSFTVTVNPVNDPPTLNPIADLYILEDAGTQTINLSGIGSGAPDENQTLTVRATNTAPTLLANFSVTYNSPSAGATLSFSTVTNAFGTNTITVTVNDGGTSNNVITRTFTVGVASVNDLPTISGIADTAIDEDTFITVNFTIGDVENDANDLVLAASSSNTGLVSTASMTFGGSSSNRSVILRPLTNAYGTATITLTVADSNGGMTSTSFNLVVNSINDLPTISSLSNRNIDEDTSTGPLAVTIGDVETAAGSLVLSASSSNPALVSSGSFTYGGSGSNRTVSILPLTNANGSATITVTVTDGDGGMSSTSFLLTVNPVSDPPVINPIPDQTTDEDVPITVNFTIGDAETAASGLTVVASSSNTGLVSTASMTLGGSSSNRTVAILPLTNANGVVTITLTVTDGSGLMTSASFNLTVNPVNELPTITPLSDLVIDEDTSTGPIHFTIGDAETPVGSLALSAISSNTNLVSNFFFGGSGSNITVTIQPLTNASGAATITVSVRDTDGGRSSSSFHLTVNAVNDPPLVSVDTNNIPRINEDTFSLTVDFTVQDVESPVTSLIVTASSGDTNLVANANIHLDGTGTNRTVTINPTPDQHGSATITITATDPDGGSTSRTFAIGINAVNDAPTLNPIGNLTLSPNAPAQTVNLSGITSGPPNESAQNLTVTAVSSNPSLIPNPVVNYISPNTTGSLNFTPAPNLSGVATITVTVQDDAGTALGGTDSLSRTFQITVNGAPALTIVRNNNVVVLSWPTNPSGYNLEALANLLVPGAWTNVTTPVSVIGGQNVVTNSLGDGDLFFRLHKP